MNRVAYFLNGALYINHLPPQKFLCINPVILKNPKGIARTGEKKPRAIDQNFLESHTRVMKMCSSSNVCVGRLGGRWPPGSGPRSTRSSAALSRSSLPAVPTGCCRPEITKPHSWMFVWGPWVHLPLWEVCPPGWPLPLGAGGRCPHNPAVRPGWQCRGPNLPSACLRLLREIVSSKTKHDNMLPRLWGYETIGLS